MTVPSLFSGREWSFSNRRAAIQWSFSYCSVSVGVCSVSAPLLFIVCSVIVAASTQSCCRLTVQPQWNRLFLRVVFVGGGGVGGLVLEALQQVDLLGLAVSQVD